MAADVSYLVRVMNGGDSNEPGKSTAPITRDLLGGCCTHDSKELDLDLQVPCGWEKRLDLKSGKVYLQRSNSSSSESKPQNNNMSSKFQDLNFPPSSKQTLNLFDENISSADPILDLKLVSPTALSPPSSNYQSVCTLDKVKSALQRAEKESTRKRSSVSMSKSSSSPRSTSSSTSVMDVGSSSDVLDREEKSSTGSVATGCPRCLLYVLISRGDPKCPQCNSVVPLPAAFAGKKPRIDLNISI